MDPETKKQIFDLAKVCLPELIKSIAYIIIAIVGYKAGVHKGESNILKLQQDQVQSNTNMNRAQSSSGQTTVNVYTAPAGQQKEESVKKGEKVV